jgi:hypothetical protein
MWFILISYGYIPANYRPNLYKIISIIIKLLPYGMGWEESRVYLLEDDKEDTTLNY